MRILVLGAGAVGGYFGGRLAEAGRDVTFLVRGPRAAALAEYGLKVASPLGDFQVPVKVATADRVGGPYDLVLLTAKHYDLDAALDAIRPGIGANTAVLPLLNGLVHLDRLDAAFGPAHVLGTACPASPSASVKAGSASARGRSKRCLPAARSAPRQTTTSCRRCGKNS